MPHRPALPASFLLPAGEIPLDVTFEFLCSYLAELTLMDYGMLNYLPSTIAASCVQVALFMLNKPTWSPTLSHYSGYLPRDLRHCSQVRAAARCGLGMQLVQCSGIRLGMCPRPGECTSQAVSHTADPSPSLQAVHGLFMAAKNSNLPASREKYAAPKFASVSQLGCADALPDWMFI